MSRTLIVRVPIYPPCPTGKQLRFCESGLPSSTTPLLTDLAMTCLMRLQLASSLGFVTSFIFCPFITCLCVFGHVRVSFSMCHMLNNFLFCLWGGGGFSYSYLIGMVWKRRSFLHNSLDRQAEDEGSVHNI